jgi:hypothetical protein
LTASNYNADFSEADLIKALQQVGESGQLTAKTQQILSELESSGINHSGPEYWDIVCSGMTQSEQCNLFKGLVIAERDLGLTGGSVSATSKVFKILSDSMPLAGAYGLAVWSTEVSPNPYTPISSINAHGILRSFREHMLSSGFRNLSQAYASAMARFERERRDAYKRRQEEVQRSAEERQSKRAAVNNQKHTRRDERSGERLAQLQTARGLQPSERLQWLASTTLPLPSIPFDLFDITTMRDSQLTRETLDQLLSKLEGQKRHWKILLDFLNSRSDSLRF